MEIYLIRHIEPTLEKGTCYGQLDVSIPEDYKNQHNEIIHKLPKDFDVVFSSPLTRCKLLAEQISDAVTYDNRLKEVSFGEWEGKKWDNIDQIELNNWMENYIEIAPPNGENLTQLIDRFSSFIDDLKKQNFKKVIIISHAGIIRSAMHLFDNIEIHEIMKKKVNYGQFFCFNNEK
jgi:alpha-ribazole phosphatase